MPLNDRISEIASHAFTDMEILAEDQDCSVDEVCRLPAMLILMIHTADPGTDLKSIVNTVLRQTARIAAESTPF